MGKILREFAGKFVYLHRRNEITIMATITLTVQDESLLNKIKQACQMIKGVGSVKVEKNSKAKKYDVTQTAGFREALKDVEEGRVYHANNAEDMFKQILG